VLLRNSCWISSTSFLCFIYSCSNPKKHLVSHDLMMLVRACEQSVVCSQILSLLVNSVEMHQHKIWRDKIRMYSGPHTGSNTLVFVPELQMSVTLCFVSPDFKLHFFVMQIKFVWSGSFISGLNLIREGWTFEKLDKEISDEIFEFFSFRWLNFCWCVH